MSGSPIHRSFTSRATGAPITFDLNGETFTCRPTVPGAILLDITEAHSRNDKMATVLEFAKLYDAAIIDEDAERFAKLIRSPGGPDLDTLLELGAWLMEVIGNRPLERPSESGNGRSPSGPGTTGKRSSKASTSSPAPSIAL